MLSKDKYIFLGFSEYSENLNPKNFTSFFIGKKIKISSILVRNEIIMKYLASSLPYAIMCHIHDKMKTLYVYDAYNLAAGLESSRGHCF